MHNAEGSPGPQLSSWSHSRESSSERPSQAGPCPRVCACRVLVWPPPRGPAGTAVPTTPATHCSSSLNQGLACPHQEPPVPRPPEGLTSRDASSPLVAILIVVSLQPSQVGGGARRPLGTRAVTCPRAAPTPALRSTGPNSPIPILKSFTISEKGACSSHTGPRIELLGSQGLGVSCLCFMETRHFLKERCV